MTPPPLLTPFAAGKGWEATVTYPHIGIVPVRHLQLGSQNGGKIVACPLCWVNAFGLITIFAE